MANNTVWAKGNQHPRSSYDRCCWRPGRIAVLPGLVTLDNHLIRSSRDVRNGCGKTTADQCFRTVNREGKPFFSQHRDKVFAEVVDIPRPDLATGVLPVEHLRAKAENASPAVPCRHGIQSQARRAHESRWIASPYGK